MEFPEINNIVAAVRVNMFFRRTSSVLVINGASIALPNLSDAKWEQFDTHRWYTSAEDRDAMMKFHAKINPTVTNNYKNGDNVTCFYTEHVSTSVDTFLHMPLYFQKALTGLPTGLTGLQALYKRHHPYAYHLLQNYLNNQYYIGTTKWTSNDERAIIVTPTQDCNYERINYNTTYIM